MSKDHEYVKSILKGVPGVKEHMDKTAVQLGIKILNLRLDQDLTRQEVAEKASKEGYALSKQTICNLEAGDESLPDEYYHMVHLLLLKEEDITSVFQTEDGYQ